MNNLIEFEKEVSKNCFFLSGIFGVEKFYKCWWKIKTSFYTILKKLHELSNHNNKINFEWINDVEILFNNSKMSSSTFIQYYKVGFFFGAISFDPNTNKFTSSNKYFKNIKSIDLNEYFCISKSINDFILYKIDLGNIIKTNLMNICKSNFLFNSQIQMIFTLSVYQANYNFKNDELMIEFLKKHKSKDNTKIDGAIDEYRSQKNSLAPIIKAIKKFKGETYEYWK